MRRCNCCGDSDSPQSALTRQLLALGFTLGLSFILLLVAGLKYHDWLPMINLIYVVLTPIAVILSEAMGGGSLSFGFDERKAAWANFGSCFFGLILISIFGLPLVLLHVGTIEKEPFGLWIASTVLTFIGSIYYWIARTFSRNPAY